MALSTEQTETIRAFKQLAKGGSPINRETLREAHREGYERLAGADTKTVSSYVSQNLKSVEFIAALGFQCKKVETFVGHEILKNLAGENALFPHSIEVYRDSLKIAARLCFAYPRVKKDDDDLADRSDEELKYFAANGEWPK